MKKGIHPERFQVQAKCVCGSEFPTISTSNKVEVGICSNCHPFCTGQQKFVDAAGRIDKFNAKFKNFNPSKK